MADINVTVEPTSPIQVTIVDQTPINIELTQTGPPGEPGIDWDDFTETDLSNAFVNLFSGDPITLGTDGYAFLRWRQEGAMVRGTLRVSIRTDSNLVNSGFLPAVFGTSLPKTPILPDIGLPMGFGYCQVTETYMAGASGMIVDISSGADPDAIPALVFVSTLPVAVAFGIEGFLADGNQISFSATNKAIIVADINYEIHPDAL